MSKHAVGVMNGNFRNGDYYRYVQELGKSTPKVCPVCGNEVKSLPNFLVGKTDLCFGCYEASKTAAPHPVDVASALEPERSDSAELAATMELVGVEDTFTAHLTPNLQLLIASGAVDANGNLKPYRIKDGHRGTPMTIEELGDDGQQYPY